MDTNSINCIAKQNFDLLGFIDSNADNKKPFKEVISKFKKSYKISKEHPFQNQYQMLFLLYCIIIMREDIVNNTNASIEVIPKTEIGSLDRKWHLSNIIIKNDLKESTPKTLKYIIDNIRHAVAHGHVDCTNNLLFTFKNVHKNIELEMNGEDIYGFIRALTYYFLTQDIELRGL